MSKQTTVVVGMSGGVDSSVTALLLKEQGYQVIGATMAVWDGDCKPDGKTPVKHACYGPDEPEDIACAKQVCEKLDIPFHVIDLKNEYRNFVLDYFQEEYKRGRTPNPCVRCNHTVKFGALVQGLRQQNIQFDYFATGHYAQTQYDPKTNRYLLKRAKDRLKDQSYFLSRLSQDQLKLCMFPLGGLLKSEVKNYSKKLDLQLELKPESQNFSGVGLETLHQNPIPGNILSIDGKILGQHQGIQFYTIGQRRGLRLSAPEPLYVTSIQPKQNTITVGSKENLLGSSLIASQLNWISIPDLQDHLEASGKIRYVQKECLCKVTSIQKNEIRVDFYEPQTAITAGQTLVLYDDAVVVGSAVIDKAIHE